MFLAEADEGRRGFLAGWAGTNGKEAIFEFLTR
jgi:hypothetical protein